MKHVLISLLLVNVVPKLSAEWIKTPNGTKTHETIGLYAELHENETLQLECEQSDNPTEFVVPSETNLATRKTEYTEKHDFNYDSRFLIVKNLTESDTGTYTCKSNNSDSIYIFVHSTSIFLPVKSNFISYDGGELRIPCKTTKHVENNKIELFINGNRVASQIYDQRYGFKVTRNIITEDGSNLFECRYTENQESLYFISVPPNFEIAQKEDMIKIQSSRVPMSGGVMFAVFDIPGRNYTAKWSRLHYSSVNTKEINAEINHFYWKTVFLKNDDFLEILMIDSDFLKTNFSGKYTLTITLSNGTLKTLHWELKAENDDQELHQSVYKITPLNAVIQLFYAQNAILGILLLSAALAILSLLVCKIMFSPRVTEQTEHVHLYEKLAQHSKDNLYQS